MTKKKFNGTFILPKETKETSFLAEKFKGIIDDKEVRFPKELGAQHPFEFEDAELLYTKDGRVSGVTNKVADSVVSDFEIRVKNPNAQAIIDDFVETSGFDTKLRSWVREAYLKGNGFMELDMKKPLKLKNKETNKDVDAPNMRVLNANEMYVKRNDKGDVQKYTQYKGDLQAFKPTKKKLQEFKPDEIAHLTFNLLPNDPYGIGFIYSTEKILTNMCKAEEGAHIVVERKAGAPYHIKIGQPGEQLSPDVVDQAKKDLQYLNNKTEWVTDGNADIKMLDSPNLGEHHIKLAEHDYRQFLGGTQVPEVLMGSGQLNEGIAKEQGAGYKRFIHSLQLITQEVIKGKIIKPLLIANGFDEIPEFVWELPGEDEINARIEKLNSIINGMSTSPALRAGAEIELARILEIEGLEDILITPQEAQAQAEKDKEEMRTAMNDANKENEESSEAKKEKEVPQPEVPGAKPNANQSFKEGHQIFEKNPTDMTLKEWVNLKEQMGFNYLDYMVSTLSITDKDKFINLLAKNNLDLAEGLLGEKDINKLRVVLKDGFKNNRTIGEIENELRNNINMPDRLKDGKLIKSGAARYNPIVRTETVRLSNLALTKLYKEKNVSKVRWLAALSDRTCAQCEALNGKIFNIGETIPPAHVSCRCSTVAIIE